MKTFSLTPLDAWFFRDGRPYNEKESNQADVSSVFPPPARTLSGSFRAALARANGWTGQGEWPDLLNRVFGPSANNLGALQFTGPFLLKDGKVLWPLPRHVLGRAGKRWAPTAFLHPAGKPAMCDDGEINLPVIALPPFERRDGMKPAETAWITAHALQSVLAGVLPDPDDILPASELWKHEPRIGLRRDETTLTTGEGALYSPAYVRLCKNVSLGIGFSGLPDGMKSLPQLFPLGGESRLAYCEPWSSDPLPKAPSPESFKPDAAGNIRFTVTLLTPGCFSKPELPGAEIVSACVGKPQLIGGWDSLKREPLPLEPFSPAGSVWFCAAAPEDFDTIHKLHGQHKGAYTAHGFGQFAIGFWPSTVTNKL